MTTNPQTSFRKNQLKYMAVCLVGIFIASSQVSQAQAGGNDTLHDQLSALVELADHRESRDFASEQLRLLSRTSPQDSNLAYLHALVLVDKLRTRDAVAPAKLAVENQSRNPDVWKLRVWLTVSHEKDYDDAMATMEQLAEQMNRKQPLFLCSTSELLELSDFMGRVYGFLLGPAEVSELSLQHSEQRLLLSLTPRQTTYFTSAKTSVLENFSDRLYHVSEARTHAQNVEQDIRHKNLSESSDERSYLRGQMEQVEQMRLEARRLSANERNVIAATRGSGYNSHHPRFYLVSGGMYGHHGHAGHSYERGLGNRNYANVNYREREYNNFLSYREKNLRRRMINSSKRDQRQMRKPNNGNSRKVVSGLKKASMLHFYLPLPVNTNKEIKNLLASYR